MKRFTFKTLSILMAAVLLVAALPNATFAEEASADSSCLHIFTVTECITYETPGLEVHCKTIYDWHICLLCDYDVMVIKDSVYEPHYTETSYEDSFHYYSKDEHRIIREIIKTCVLCQYIMPIETKHFYREHDTEEYYNTYYSSYSDEYHNKVVYLEEICVFCGAIINSYEEYFELECHEFEDTVDPEVDMEGVCTICGDEVSW